MTGQTIKEDWKKVKEAFGGSKKKNKKETAAGLKNSPVNPALKPADMHPVVNVNNVFALTNGLKSGEVHPAARVLNVDELYEFNGGAAIVKKGMSSALIDGSGEFIIDFNKYDFHPSVSYHDGFFPVSVKGVYGYNIVTAKGVEVFNKLSYLSKVSECGTYAVYTTTAMVDNVHLTKYYYVDDSLRTSVFDFSFDATSKGIGYGSDPKTSVFSFYNFKSGKLFTATNYFLFRDGRFSEGMMVANKTDEYGKKKYGFINTSGELVIPLTYSNLPGSFKNGLSRVVPVSQGGMSYAYINKEGKVIISHSPENERLHGSFYKDFSNGFTYAVRGNEIKLMDTTGKNYTQAAYVKNLGLPGNAQIVTNGFEDIKQYDDGKLRFAIPVKFSDGSSFPVHGFLDLITRKVTEASFSVVKRFDPVSGLAYAEKYLGNDANGNSLVRKGYINQDGIFLIIMAKKNEW